MSTYEANRYSFSGANITALNGSNIASGTVADARIPDLATSKITSGTFADARISSSSVTAHVTAVTTAEGTWTPSPSISGNLASASGYYVRTGDIVWCYAECHFAWSGSIDTAMNNDNIWYMTGLPITPYAGSSHGDSGTGHVGWGRASFNNSNYNLWIMDNGNIYVHGQGQAMRMWETITHNTGGNSTGLIRGTTLRQPASNAFSRYFYLSFTYHV